MASIAEDPNGRKRIIFAASDGLRIAIRLGKCDRKAAESFRMRVEKIVSARLIGGSVDDETSRWIASLTDKIHARLAAAGLIKARASTRLVDFIDNWIKGRTDVKASTTTVFGHTRRNLVAFFGPDKPLNEITRGNADQWRIYLANQKLEGPTIRRRCGIAKQIFRAAVRQELIVSNPFADLTASGQSNPARSFFITKDVAQKVIDACPDAQWRLLFALSRFGGLRCPSEHLLLRWSDIDWDNGRMVVHSPKTEHHPGGDQRTIPIFPELLIHLRDAFEQREPGTDFVITQYRRANTNLRTQLNRILKRAGIAPWPKLFHNLRASRETELADVYPEHVVCKWIGNSKVIARKHYLQLTDQHFANAIAGTAEQPAQKAAQQAVVLPRSIAQTIIAPNQQPPTMPGVAIKCKSLQDKGMGGTGLEPVTPSVSCWYSSQLS